MFFLINIKNVQNLLLQIVLDYFWSWQNLKILIFDLEIDLCISIHLHVCCKRCLSFLIFLY